MRYDFTALMADIIYVGTALAFLVICAGYVRACDRLLRRDVADQTEESAR